MNIFFRLSTVAVFTTLCVTGCMNNVAPPGDADGGQVSTVASKARHNPASGRLWWSV